MVSEEIIYDLNAEFHMLRHWEQNDPAIIKNLLKSGYNKSVINGEMNLPGSRFFKDFATNISTLLSSIFRFNYEMRISPTGNLVLEFLFPNNIFPSGIGTNNLIKKSSLTYQEQKHIYYSTNRDFLLPHFNVKSLPASNKACLILKKAEDKYIFITSFPGENAMPIPNENMTKDLYVECEFFWNEHVFMQLEQNDSVSDS